MNYTFMNSGHSFEGWAKKLIQDLNKRDRELVEMINNIITEGDRIVRFYGSLEGKPSAGQELFDLEMNGDEVFAAGLPLNLGSFDVAPAFDIDLPIYVNDVYKGSMHGTVGSLAATWLFPEEYRAVRGDRLRFCSCSPQDPTMSGPRYTFIGTRVDA